MRNKIGKCKKGYHLWNIATSAYSLTCNPSGNQPCYCGKILWKDRNKFEDNDSIRRGFLRFDTSKIDPKKKIKDVILTMIIDREKRVKGSLEIF